MVCAAEVLGNILGAAILFVFLLLKKSGVLISCEQPVAGRVNKAHMLMLQFLPVMSDTMRKWLAS